MAELCRPANPDRADHKDHLDQNEIEKTEFFLQPELRARPRVRVQRVRDERLGFCIQPPR
jgi:hypothetical protein